MNVTRVSVAESRQALPRLLREVETTDAAVLIYRRDQLAAVLVGPEAFERMMRLRAYADALRLSEELSGLDVDAVEAARESRQLAEERT